MGLALIFLINTEFFSFATILILADRFILEVGYMIKYILVLVGICIVLWQPWLIIVGGIVGIIVAVMYLLANKPNSFTTGLSTPARAFKDREDNLPRQKDFITYEERQEKEMSSIKLKKGFQDDPRWQALAKKAYIHVEKAQELEEAELRELGQNIKNMG